MFCFQFSHAPVAVSQNPMRVCLNAVVEADKLSLTPGNGGYLYAESKESENKSIVERLSCTAKFDYYKDSSGRIKN